MKKSLFIILVLLIVSCSRGTKESYIKSILPEGLTEVKEYYRDTGLSGDYIRLLKAKASKEDYETLAQKLKLTQKYSEYLKTRKINIRKRAIHNPPDWWDEPMESHDFYFIKDFNKEYERRLKWKDGWLYFATEAW